MPLNYVSAQTANVTSATVVYNPTTAGVQATMIGCLVANKTASTITVLVTLTNATSTVTTQLAPSVFIPPNNAFDVLSSAKIVVPQNYSVSVTSSGSADVTISAGESS
jgi:hypothetical protein